MINEDLFAKPVNELTKQEKDFLYKKLLTLFLNWNGTDIASDSIERFETQEAVFYFLNLLDKN